MDARNTLLTPDVIRRYGAVAAADFQKLDARIRLIARRFKGTCPEATAATEAHDVVATIAKRSADAQESFAVLVQAIDALGLREAIQAQMATVRAAHEG